MRTPFCPFLPPAFESLSVIQGCYDSGHVCAVSAVVYVVRRYDSGASGEIITVIVPDIAVAVIVLVGAEDLVFVSPHIRGEFRMGIIHAFVQNGYYDIRISAA